MKIRPSKSQVIKIITRQAPEYVDFFMEFKADAHGWLILPDKLIQAKNNLNINQYVTLYRDQKTIDTCLMLFLMGKDGLKEWNSELATIPVEEQQKECESIIQEILDEPLDYFDKLLPEWPESQEEIDAARTAFESMDNERKKAEVQRAQYLLMHIFLSIHNLFSVMTNGESMVSLVPKAIQGDDESLFKAIKVDRNLIDHHPYFVERIKRAKLEGEKEFIKELARYQARPNLISQIKLPGLYVVFAMLDVMSWLDDFSHEEILDLCDAAKLDRWQHSIVDTNAVTKRLAQYRRYQKTGGVSMH
ncbi:hypothetical protein [Methylotenera mobilis]|uniref:hypothetical protein n=1 Tax=Methylotenera mobilis TaxID=359408 RepID=UPI00039BCA0E|nr:hypothetical protein [Methylotenera mobilis]PPC96076.1 MAG: hypothetical protein CTY32_06835 [Methylotenera sp.]